MCSIIFLLSAFFLKVAYASSYPTVWNKEWTEELPLGGKGRHQDWIGYGTGDDGRKYMGNGWHNTWQSGNDGSNSGWHGDDSGWSKKQVWEDGVTGNGKHRWAWGSGGAQSWGSWGSDDGTGSSSNEWKKWSSKGDGMSKFVWGSGWGDDWSGDKKYVPEQNYYSWGNINSDTWKNSGGGERWSKWDTDNDGPDHVGHHHGGWKSWKSGSGSGKWDSWNSSNWPKSAKAEAYAKASTDP